MNCIILGRNKTEPIFNDVCWIVTLSKCYEKGCW